MAMAHFSTTRATSLSSAMTAVATSVSLVDGSSYPDPSVPGNGQYTVIIGYGSDREEVCTVISKPGVNQLTVLRGQDGTTATSKNIGDTVVHGVSARDYEGYLPTSGGTVTGAIVLPGDPANALEAAPKQYVDLRAPIASPTFTGNVVVPIADASGEAVNKGQVDASLALLLPKAGGTMTGPLELSSPHSVAGVQQGVWEEYTPVLGNWTIGNGTTSGAFCRIGDTIHFQARLTLGTTTIVSGTPTITFPVTATSAQALLWGTFVDNGSSFYQAFVRSNSTAIAAIYVAGTNGVAASPTPTLPFPWAATDYIAIAGTYEAA